MPRDETGVNPAKGIGALRHPPRNLTIELQKQRPRRPQGERGLGTEEGNGPYRWEPLGYWRPAASTLDACGERQRGQPGSNTVMASCSLERRCYRVRPYRLLRWNCADSLGKLSPLHLY